MKKTILLVLFIASFSLSAEAQYTKIFDFAGVSTGSLPISSLFYDGTFLYGMTVGGGTKDMGAIFKIKPQGNGFLKMLDFTGSANGSNPGGSLISDGTFLYGMAWGGGSSDSGIIFKIKPDRTGFSKILDFAGTNGSNPVSSLIYDGTYLYGTTGAGGMNHLGIVFKIKPDGTLFSKLLDFAGAANGGFPNGDLLYEGTFLYGMTTKGGTNDSGTIFKLKPDGSGYTKLLDFGGTNGSYPLGSLISDGTFLYGMTRLGGTNNEGVIFKIKPDGTSYSKLFDFSAFDGSWPLSTLISAGSFLYGTAAQKGPNNFGTLFKIKSDGSGFSKLVDFEGTTNGSYPYGALISVGNSLYGMTDRGGTNNLGTIFKYGITAGIPEKNAEASFQIYPNPNTGQFSIKNEGSSLMNYNLEIYNMLGEKIHSAPNIHQSSILNIDISNAPKGIYFIRIAGGEKIYTEKILIE